MKLSIRSRLIFSFAGVIALVLVCQLAFNLFFAKSYYLTYQENQMYSAYAQIYAEYDGTIESMEATVSDYETNNNIEVIVWLGEQVWYTSYDRLLYGTGDHQINGGSPIVLPDITGQVEQAQQELVVSAQVNVSGEARRGRAQETEQAQELPQVLEIPQTQEELDLSLDEENSEYHIESQGGADILHFVDAFEYEGQIVTVALTLSLDSIESSAEVFSNSSLAISLVALLIGLVYSLVLSKSITKPVLEMEKIAGEFANLDFSRRANESVSATELYHLSKSLNSMSAQLEKAIASLNIANERLQQDIDYQKQMEQMRREFVGNVSHEMKTPLTMLQIYAESLKENIDSVDKDYYCDTIMEETETLNDLVASMLDISSIESGLSKMQMEDLDLSMLLTSLIERMQPMLANYQLRYEVEPGLDLLGDGKYLEQAMKNYITNAMEHTVKNGKIQIALYQKNDAIYYQVQNEGKQIDTEEMPRLWDSFYRSDKARNRVNKNVGLGLHIVKTVLEKHGGTCQCENMPQGVCFSFSLPKTQQL